MKDTKIWDNWQRSEIFGKGKSKSVKYWTALGRTLISKGLLKEVKQSMAGAGATGFGARSFAYMGCAPTKTGNELLSGEEPLMLPVTGDLNERRVKQKPSVITPRFGTEQTPEDLLRTKLYTALVEERQKLATLFSLPPYMVITEQTMLQLAQTRPSTTATLKRVQGFSEAKVLKYGEPFLGVIDRFVAQHPTLKLDDFLEETTPDEIASKPGLSETVRATYLLFREKRSLEAVVTARGLAASTVLGHLAAASGRPLFSPLYHAYLT